MDTSELVYPSIDNLASWERPRLMPEADQVICAQKLCGTKRPSDKVRALSTRLLRGLSFLIRTTKAAGHRGETHSGLSPEDQQSPGPSPAHPAAQSFCMPGETPERLPHVYHS
jgi:hypothetical protein